MGRPKGSKNKLKTNKTLEELAQELITYCLNNTGVNNVYLQVRVPQSLLDFESSRHQPSGDVTLPNLGMKLNLTGGVVELNPNETVGA